MKKLIAVMSAAVLAVALLSVIQLTTGCVTSKVPTVTNGTTNFVTVVNTNNLILDSAVLQGATAVAVAQVVHDPKNADVIPALKSAQVALDGILNGSNPQTTQQVLTMLKASDNPALSAEITSLISTLSALEQNLLAKYGVSVAGQIGVAVTRAIDSGLIIGLAGH